MLSYVLLAVLLAIPFSLHAQQNSGIITGTVTDPSGAAVPGATITVISTATAAQNSAKSDAQGNFSLAQLPVGTYELRVRRQLQGICRNRCPGSHRKRYSSEPETADGPGD
jgi:hypothetical protein